MEDILIEEIKRRSVVSLFSVSFCQILAQFVSSILGIFIARRLHPGMFGMFAIVNFVITFASLIREMGLGMALIQKKEELDKDDITTAFTIQFFLSLVLVLGILLFGRYIVRWYKLPLDGEKMLLVCSTVLIFYTFSGISSSKLIRSLQLDKVSFIWTINNIFFQTLTLVFAYSGYGVWSFIWATIITGTVSAVLFYYLSPWDVCFGINIARMKRLLKFGIPYQMYGVVNILKEAVNPAIVGKFCNEDSVGYFDWSSKTISFSVIFNSMLNQITFPLFSRLQENNELLASAIEKALKLSSMMFYPLFSAITVFIVPIVHYVYTDKWFAAVPAFYLLAASILLTGPIGMTFFNVFSAVGKPHWATNFNVLYCVLNYALGALFVAKYDFIGLALAKVVISYVTLLPLYIFLKRISPQVRVFNNILPYLFCCLPVALFFKMFTMKFINNVLSLLVMVFLCVVCCYLVIFIFKRREILEEYSKVKEIFLK
jgi:PST family polysaccharide transporter